MAKKTLLSEEDQIAFKDAIKGTKPLQHAKADLIIPNKVPPKKRPQEKFENSTDELIFSLQDKLPPVSSHERLLFSRSGLQQKMLRKLRQGEYNVDAILDLHGQKVDEAEKALQQFILYCVQENLRHILIIHGKGKSTNQPILKNKLNNWLRQINHVLAFSSATPKDGDTGALYVLLRRERGE
jgi:DNA-nicking Smr family endonuclease